MFTYFEMLHQYIPVKFSTLDWALVSTTNVCPGKYTKHVNEVPTELTI